MQLQGDFVQMYGAENDVVQGWCRKMLQKLPHPGFTKAPLNDRKKIFLCMTPRSGSSYLSSVLRANKLGQFNEHFRVVQGSLETAIENDKLKTFEDWVHTRIKKRSAHGHFGVKLDWLQFIPVYYLGAYDYYFRDASFIYLTRGDILMQAISRYISSTTGYFHSTNVEKEETLKEEVPFDFDAIWKHVVHLAEMQKAWELFFAAEGISPLRITYEDIDEDACAVVRRIIAYAGLEEPKKLELETDFKKVRTERNTRLRERVVEEARRRRKEAEAIYAAPAAGEVAAQ